MSSKRYVTLYLAGIAMMAVLVAGCGSEDEPALPDPCSIKISAPEATA